MDSHDKNPVKKMVCQGETSGKTQADNGEFKGFSSFGG